MKVMMISSVAGLVATATSVEVAAQPRGTMDRTGGWMDGGTGGGEWIWIVVGVLVAVLLVVMIAKQFNARS